MLKRLIRGIRVLLLRNDIAHLESAIDEERERHAQFDARMRSWMREVQWRRGEIERLYGRPLEIDWSLAGYPSVRKP
ncbi:MAG TPA: hypothetical protein VMS04_15720 [Vicinamibacterales bacterium]|jgi:hypothetical protein|nr:hypothetical protein [Vicinamibacterales bacterium]